MGKRQKKIQKVVNNRQEGIIVLEDIHDPHNIGAVCRSAEGLGFQKVWLVFEEEATFNPKRVGRASSSSANKWLDFRRFKTTKRAMAELKKEGYEIWATTLGGGAMSLWKAKFKNKKIALVLGNEHRGVSEEAIKSADYLLTIPMRGMVQSFNISVAGAMILAEISRQRRIISQDKWKLEAREREELVRKWR